MGDFRDWRPKVVHLKGTHVSSGAGMDIDANVAQRRYASELLSEDVWLLILAHLPIDMVSAAPLECGQPKMQSTMVLD